MASLPGYDAYLERPYVEAAERADQFEKWCEDHSVDADDPQAEELYQEWLEDLYSGYEPDYDEFDVTRDDWDDNCY